MAGPTRRDDERDQTPSVSVSPEPSRDDLDDLVSQVLAAAPWRGVVYAIVYAFRRLAVTAFATPYLLITGHAAWIALPLIALALVLDLYVAPRHAVDLRDGGRDYIARILSENLDSYKQEESVFWDKTLRILLWSIGLYYGLVVLPCIVFNLSYLNSAGQHMSVIGGTETSIFSFFVFFLLYIALAFTFCRGHINGRIIWLPVKKKEHSEISIRSIADYKYNPGIAMPVIQLISQLFLYLLGIGVYGASKAVPPQMEGDLIGEGAGMFLQALAVFVAVLYSSYLKAFAVARWRIRMDRRK